MSEKELPYSRVIKFTEADLDRPDLDTSKYVSRLKGKQAYASFRNNLNLQAVAADVARTGKEQDIWFATPEGNVSIVFKRIPEPNENT